MAACVYATHITHKGMLHVDLLIDYVLINGHNVRSSRFVCKMLVTFCFIEKLAVACLLLLKVCRKLVAICWFLHWVSACATTLWSSPVAAKPLIAGIQHINSLWACRLASVKTRERNCNFLVLSKEDFTSVLQVIILPSSYFILIVFHMFEAHLVFLLVCRGNYQPTKRGRTRRLGGRKASKAKVCAVLNWK